MGNIGIFFANQNNELMSWFLSQKLGEGKTGGLLTTRKGMVYKNINDWSWKVVQ